MDIMSVQLKITSVIIIATCTHAPLKLYCRSIGILTISVIGNCDLDGHKVCTTDNNNYYYSHTHAPLQLCIVAPLLCSPSCHWKLWFGTTIQSCSGAWVWLIIILVIRSVVQTCPCILLHLFSNFIQLVPILFTPVQLRTFLNFWENFYNFYV